MNAAKELEFITKNPKKVERFAGQWIAVLDNKILASGKTVDETVRRSKSKRTPLVFKVPRKDEEMYIL